eukprot:371957-Pyramimonas_sp.AAC.1
MRSIWASLQLSIILRPRRPSGISSRSPTASGDNGGPARAMYQLFVRWGRLRCTRRGGSLPLASVCRMLLGGSGELFRMIVEI